MAAPNGNYFSVCFETFLNTPTATLVGVYNQAGITVALHEFSLITSENNIRDLGDCGISLNRGVGGSVVGAITALPLKAGTGDVPVQSAGFFSTSGTTWTILITFPVNIRKGLRWQAKKGKEFKIHNLNDSFALRLQTGGGYGGKDAGVTMIFEE